MRLVIARKGDQLDMFGPSKVKGHTRRTKQGKVAVVKPHERKRRKSKAAERRRRLREKMHRDHERYLSEDGPTRRVGSYTWRLDHERDAETDTLIEVDAHRAAERWREEAPGQAIGPRGLGGIGTRYQQARAFLANPPVAIKAPRIGLTDGGDLFVEDGRHRLVAAADLGMRIAVQVPRDQANKVRRALGGSPGFRQYAMIRAELASVDPSVNDMVRSAWERGGIDAVESMVRQLYVTNERIRRAVAQTQDDQYERRLRALAETTGLEVHETAVGNRADGGGAVEEEELGVSFAPKYLRAAGLTEDQAEALVERATGIVEVYVRDADRRQVERDIRAAAKADSARAKQHYKVASAALDEIARIAGGGREGTLAALEELEQAKRPPLTLAKRSHVVYTDRDGELVMQPVTPPPVEQVKLQTERVSRSAMRAFVRAHHRHLPTPPPGEIAAYGVRTPDGQLRGVVALGRPTARQADDSRAKVTRGPDGSWQVSGSDESYATRREARAAAGASTVEADTLEITRAATDGTPNANSALYGAALRHARRMGASTVITYTLPEESGASLRAVGFERDDVTQPGQWDRKGRRRKRRTGAIRKGKVRWVREL